MSGWLLDTALNLVIFVYLGFLVWLAMRPSPDADDDADPGRATGGASSDRSP